MSRMVRVVREPRTKIRAVAMALTLTTLVLTGQASAQVVGISWTSESVGNGLTAYTVGVEFYDGGLDGTAAFAELDFEGSIEQIQYEFNQEIFDLHLDTDLFLADLDPAYDSLLDSYFLEENTPWTLLGAPIGEIIDGQPGDMIFGIRAFATEAGGGIVDYADIAYIVVPSSEAFTVTGRIARAAVWYDVDATLPEPGAAVAQLAVVSTLVLLARSRRSGAHGRS